MVVDLKPNTDLPAEQQAIRAKCFHPSGTFVEFKREEIEQSIPDRFEQQVAKYPERIAVKTRNYAFTYDELNQAANRVARAILAERGEGEEPIALLFEHNAPMIVAILGVLKAGKFYVPLDPSLPHARISYVLDDSQASLILSNNKNFSSAKELAQNRLLLLNIEGLEAALSDGNLGLSVSPNCLAYLLYTSGSTGQSKGVIHNHRNVLHNILIRTNAFHICAQDRLTLFSFSTGQAVKNILGALLNGAALYPFDVRKEGLVRLADWLIREEITTYLSSSSLYRRFVETLTGREEFPNLRLIRLGSESLTRRDIELYEGHFSPSCILVNGLSTTESGTVRKYFIDKQIEIVGDKVPVGYPVDDHEILLLDDTEREVGLNEVGEIAVRSRYLSPGYWRRPDLTQAKFLPGPNGGDRRIYLTGDLGRMMPDGCLEHLGRKDFRAKIRGYGVEVTEIETALMAMENIKEAVVVSREDQGEERCLVAYIVPMIKTPSPTVKVLRRALREKLPDYMIPSAFVILDAMPITPNGKVDRRALPAPGQSRPELESPFIAPRTPVEEALARIWAEVLKLEQVGVHDNFFDLGGHSLLATKLISRLCEELQVDLPVRVLFESPTIAQLAVRIEGEGNEILHGQEEKGAYSHLVELRTGQSQKRIFCFPYMWGVKGEYSHFFRLVRHMGPDYSFYGLQAQGADEVGQLPSSIEDLAVDYVREIQTLQPHGPYFLVGECGGGPQAYETARQLWVSGEKVALLALMDTRGPYVSHRYRWGGLIWAKLIDRLRYRMVNSPIWPPLNYFLMGTAFHLRKSKQLEGGKRWHYLFDKTDKAIRAIPHVFRRETSSQSQQVDTDISEAERQLLGHLGLARKAYRQNWRWPYGGRITLLVNEHWYGFDRTFGWADVAAGGVEVHTIPGDHDSYMLDHDQTVAEKLIACIEKAEKEA